MPLMKTKREVLQTMALADDLLLHVCRIQVTSGKEIAVLGDIREYVPSLKTYGRGITLDWPDFVALIGVLEEKSWTQ